jgi:hypothetical protein
VTSLFHYNAKHVFVYSYAILIGTGSLLSTCFWTSKATKQWLLEFFPPLKHLEWLQVCGSIHRLTEESEVSETKTETMPNICFCSGVKTGRSIFRVKCTSSHRCLRRFSDMFYVLTRTEMSPTANERAEICRVIDKIKRLVCLMCQIFLKKSPGLSLRKPEATSTNQVPEITVIFENLERLMTNQNFVHSYL